MLMKERKGRKEDAEDAEDAKVKTSRLNPDFYFLRTLRNLCALCVQIPQIDMPPSMAYACPVTKADSSLARNTTNGAISCAVASRPNGWRAMKA